MDRGPRREPNKVPGKPSRVGETVVFKVQGQVIPVVHRFIKVHEKDDGDSRFLTQGGTGEVADRRLYKQGPKGLGQKDVVGGGRGFCCMLG